MARKRLTPVVEVPSPTPPGGAVAARAFAAAQPVRRDPPIARVAGETAAEAALAALSEEVAQARAEGRLIVPLGLAEIDETHLVRDRVDIDEGEMQVLMTSLGERGQQTAIEVVDFGEGRKGPRYGLISGWRRLMALRRLSEATGEARFARVRALVRRPESASDAYRSMVDENEIRVGLSYWERARIAVEAAEAGIYPTTQHALRDLFSAASRPKRSKIGSFMGLYAAFGDEVLRFPAALPERLGLQLARALEERGADLTAAILERRAATPPEDAAGEQALLSAVLAGLATPVAKPGPAGSVRRETPPPGQGAAGRVRLTRTAPDRLVLEGPGADAALEAALAKWLKGR
ncbi:ParB/RepB/Spo0J family partition protein [Tropicimonas sp.]|uniref:ParB/RepB/Spo0J family partition protein n=1 Tax=Tropicimonas sp. TaxID=2067044 RepID=UPI003A8856C9